MYNVNKIADKRSILKTRTPLKKTLAREAKGEKTGGKKPEKRREIVFKTRR